MPLTYKTTATSWLTGWTPGTGATYDGIIDASAGSGPFSTGTNSLFLSSLKVDSTAASSISATASAYNTVLGLGGSSPYLGHTVYMAPNKTLLITQAIVFANNFVHSVFIESGAVLTANAASVVAGENLVQKKGEGTWRIASNENATDSTNSNIGAWELYAGTLATGSGSVTPVLRTATIGFFGGTLQVRFSRTFTNTITVNAAGGTITTNSGAVATMSNAASGSGILTVTGAGNVAWNNTISCPLNVTGLLTMGTNNRITSATITGTGTIGMNGGEFGQDSTVNASSHTGAITGTCGIRGGASTFASDFQGTVTIFGGFITLQGTSSGSIPAVNNSATLNVRSQINGGGGSSTSLTANTTLNFAANGRFASNRTIAATAATIGLSETASVASPISVTDTTISTLQTNDTTTNTYSGALSSSGASGTTRVMALTGSTLILSGSVTGSAGRTYNLNTDSGYAGTIRVTGAGFTTSAVTLSRGRLDLNRADSIGLGSGLTASANTTVACYSTGAYAAQLSGNLTLSAGSTMKFGTV